VTVALLVTRSDPASSEARPPAPAALLERLAAVAGMEPGRRRLVLLWPQLGDFDSLEYAQALVPALPRLDSAGIGVLAIGIGNEASRQRFCAFTGFPARSLAGGRRTPAASCPGALRGPGAERRTRGRTCC
jgi:hypothetical protein